MNDKTDLSIWGLKKEFTINELAHLWFGIDPYNLHRFELPGETIAKIRGMRRILQEAVKRGELRFKGLTWRDIANAPTGWTGAKILPETNTIDREEITVWAEKNGERPWFLFPEDQKLAPAKLEDKELSSEEFIRSITVFVEDNGEIGIRLPGKKKTFSCQQIGFNRYDTKEWQRLREILEDPYYEFKMESRPYKRFPKKRGEAEPHEFYDAERKLLKRINKKLIKFFENFLDKKLPPKFRFYEKTQWGTYRLIFSPPKKDEEPSEQ
jgi:hypothetical protein